MDKGYLPDAATPPDFMVEDAEKNGPRRLAERMRQDPEFYINAAMYAANNISTSERLLLLTEALTLKKISKLGEWQFEVEIYPETPMASEDLNRTRNGEMPFRAFYLLEALTKLLSLVGAPEAMRSDLCLFMRSKLPYTAMRRAEFQKYMIDHADWTDTKLANEFGYDLTRMGEEIENKHLLRFPLVPDHPEQS